MSHHLFKITLNFLAVVLLISLVAIPFFFAKNFSQIAGVKTATLYLVISQIEKFPNLILSQSGDRFTINYTKYGDNQAFLGVLIINNPTDRTQSYSLEVTSGQAKVFFGEDLDNPITEISVPSSASVPISLLSSQEFSSENQTVEFVLNPDN